MFPFGLLTGFWTLLFQFLKIMVKEYWRVFLKRSVLMKDSITKCCPFAVLIFCTYLHSYTLKIFLKGYAS